MGYHIESIDFFARLLPPGRMKFTLGKQAPDSDTKPQPPRRPGAVALCRLVLRTPDGRTVVGASGDRPSYGWLDKRTDRDSLTKLRALVSLMESARDQWMENPDFESLFPHWLKQHEAIMQLGVSSDHEALTASYASAMIERALIDAICRAQDQPLWFALRENRFGIVPESVHPQLQGFDLAGNLPAAPRSRFFIRHTVGLGDPITEADLDERIDDGEPETLAEYARRDGLRYFKVKISGNPDSDLERLRKIWEAIPQTPETAITLDGNEAYEDLGEFSGFVDRLAESEPGLFDHVLFIEQPLTRRLTLDPDSQPWIERIRTRKPLVIDEADGELDAFRRAHAIGYSGTSHKNCKGFFKSLLNRALCQQLGEKETGEMAPFMSGEDLSLMPIVPLHQDFAALGVLDLPHCERNGHHYAYGLSHLSGDEKAMMLRDHPDLYVERRDEVFLNIVDGAVTTTSIQIAPGFGVKTLPDWESLEPLRPWLDQHYPA